MHIFNRILIDGGDIMSEDKLTDKQRCFVDEYMIDLNGTQAAIRAGYSPKTAQEQASRLIKNKHVKEALDIARAKRAAKAAVDAEYVLIRLKEVAERCLQQKPVQVFDKTERCMVQAKEEVIDEDGNVKEAGVYQFDSVGANKSLELIGKHLGMFEDKFKMTGDLSLNIKVDYGDGGDG